MCQYRMVVTSRSALLLTRLGEPSLGSGPSRRLRRTIVCMDEATDLRDGSHWRVAVRGLRAIGPGLALVIAGLVTLNGPRMEAVTQFCAVGSDGFADD